MLGHLEKEIILEFLKIFHVCSRIWHQNKTRGSWWF